MKARLGAALSALAVLAAGLLVAGALAATGGSSGRGRLVEVPLSPQTDHVHTAPAIWDLAADPTGGTVAAVDDPSLGLGLFAVAQFRPDGTLDRGFGRRGYARLRMRGRPQAKAVAVQPDGAILVAGYALRFGGVARPILARFRPGGSPDLSFGDGGVVSPEPANEQPFESEAPQAVAVAPDGRILVAGSTEEEGVGKSGRHPAGFVAAYEPDGSIDTGFGAAGRVYFRGAHEGPGNQYTGLKAIQVMADGRILVAGFRQDELFLARLTPDGQPDPTFGGGSGEVTVATDEAGGCYDLCWASTPLALLPDGGIVTVASAFPDLPKIVRLLPDGTRDPSFGNNGVVKIRAGTRFLTFDMALQGQRIVVVGWEAIQGERVSLAFGVQRYLPSGRIDRAFGRLGVDSRDRGPDSVALAALSEPGGRVLVGGGVSKPGHIHRLALVDYPPVTSR